MVNIFWSEFYCFFYQGRSRLEDYFHEFSQYEIPPEALPEIEQHGADREFTRAKYFIRDNFLQVRLKTIWANFFSRI